MAAAQEASEGAGPEFSDAIQLWTFEADQPPFRKYMAWLRASINSADVPSPLAPLFPCSLLSRLNAHFPARRHAVATPPTPPAPMRMRGAPTIRAEWRLSPAPRSPLLPGPAG